MILLIKHNQDAVQYRHCPIQTSHKLLSLQLVEDSLRWWSELWGDGLGWWLVVSPFHCKGKVHCEALLFEIIKRFCRVAQTPSNWDFNFSVCFCIAEMSCWILLAMLAAPLCTDNVNVSWYWPFLWLRYSRIRTNLVVLKVLAQPPRQSLTTRESRGSASDTGSRLLQIWGGMT